MPEDTTREGLEQRIRDLENERIELRRFEHLIHIQRDLAVALSAAGTLDEGLRLSVDAVLQASGMDCGGIYLVDRPSGALRLVSHKGLPPDFVRRSSLIEPDTPRARLVMAGESIYTQHQSLGVPLDDVLEGERLLAIAVIPICHQGRVIGCLNASSHSLSEVPEFSRLALETIAAHLGSEIVYLQVKGSLRESEERYKTLIESSPDAILVMDTERKIVSCNRAFQRLFGYDLMEISGLSIRLIHPSEESYQRFGRVAYEVIKRESAYRGEWHFRHKDGSLVPVETVTSVIRYPGGETGGYMAIIRNITERKLAEQALRESKERFRILVENSPLGVALISKDGRYEYLSPKFQEIFGYTSEDIPTGRDWFRKAYPDPEYRRKIVAIWKKDVEECSGGEIRARLFRATCTDGSEKLITFRTVVMENGQSLITYEDSTEQKRREAQIQQAQKMEALGTLAGGISHDFNNILSAIIGYTELAALGAPAESKTSYYLQQALKGTSRAKDLVNQILTFSRQREQERRPTDVVPIIKEALRLLRASLPTTIEIRVHSDPDIGIIEADSTRIHQVLMNLCTNAAHAMNDDGGILEVNLNRVNLDDEFTSNHPGLLPGPHLKMTVSDTGTGIAPEVLDRIFEPYFTTKGEGEGTGLGLALVHGVVKSHAGAITVSSEPGRGSVFTVFLPIIDTDVTGESPTEKSLPLGSERILFVDDEPALAEIGEGLLRSLGYDVVATTSSLEARDLFRAQPYGFDLVITDMTMPRMTGEILARELISIRPDIPVIISTGFSVRVTEERASAMGVRAFMMKPLVMGDLARTIRKVLDET
ncbi:MAG: PAS domain S-box protein [Deltaproteobacteria bacterium]|nr:PAS domain S-box protein [Deltaproteobacteria bacterium]